MNIRNLIFEARNALPLPSEVPGEVVRVYLSKREEPSLVYEFNFKKSIVHDICVGWEFLNEDPTTGHVIKMDYSEGQEGTEFSRVA